MNVVYKGALNIMTIGVGTVYLSELLTWYYFTTWSVKIRWGLKNLDTL